jgi:peroxiredoxin
MNRTALASAVLVLLHATAVSAAPYAPRVGQPHPDFTLPNLADGKPVSLSDFHGKKVLLIQFASW